MNDSFLEDLELVSNSPNSGITVRQLGGHVTTRRTSSAANPKTNDVLKQVEAKQKPTEIVVLDNKSAPKKDVDRKKESSKPSSKTRHVGKMEKVVEGKSKVVEKKVSKESGDNVLKAQEDIAKALEGRVVKDRSRRSGSQRQPTPDSSSKENSNPSDSSKESEGFSKKSDSKDMHYVTLLKGIKEIVSTYTKQETTQILRAMQELHMNSQSNLIKHLLLQTEDLVKEMHPTVDSARMKNIIEENRRLNEEVVLLQILNGELQKKLQDFEFLKQENVALKLKCQELSQQ